MLDSGGVVGRGADVALRERLLELVQGGRHGQPKEGANEAEHEHEEDEDCQRLGHPPVPEPLDARAHCGGERQGE